MIRTFEELVRVTLKKLAALLCALVLCLAGLSALAEDETVDEGGSTL